MAQKENQKEVGVNGEENLLSCFDELKVGVMNPDGKERILDLSVERDESLFFKSKTKL